MQLADFTLFYSRVNAAIIADVKTAPSTAKGSI
jgi:hypothetical protein